MFYEGEGVDGFEEGKSAPDAAAAWTARVGEASVDSALGAPTDEDSATVKWLLDNRLPALVSVHKTEAFCTDELLLLNEAEFRQWTACHSLSPLCVKKLRIALDKLRLAKGMPPLKEIHTASKVRRPDAVLLDPRVVAALSDLWGAEYTDADLCMENEDWDVCELEQTLKEIPKMRMRQLKKWLLRDATDTVAPKCDGHCEEGKEEETEESSTEKTAVAKASIAKKKLSFEEVYAMCHSGDSESLADAFGTHRIDIDIDANCKGFTCLFAAAQNGHFRVVKLLLEKGANPNIANAMDGGTPLFSASEKGHIEVVRILVAAKAAINKATKSGCTPLFVASNNGYVQVVYLLIGAKADINKANNNGSTPLIVAAYKGHTAVVSLLLESGADIDIKNYGKGDALYYARVQKHTEIESLLLASKKSSLI